jgi:hypothetical protein
MNIKKPIAKKVAVAFPDAAMKPVPMPSDNYSYTLAFPY